ncbi:MAG: hypothetical protein JW816_03425 [Candidatus Buchananbacteria bacterium]|nr:hypothetical protein [Candidatus Buchananbacteria bacterium]
MMDQAIKDFAKQFTYQPAIENQSSFKPMNKFILCGMGGSHLCGDLFRTIKPDVDLIIHSNYGLPQIDLSDRLVVASSYSGNTEETIDAFESAIEKGLPVIVISVGGKLIELAKMNKVAYIQLPDTDIEPRSALGFSFRALLLATGQQSLLEQSDQMATVLQPAALEQAGKALASEFNGYVPIIYSSDQNFALAYNWKIKLNETGKIPAFYNLLPELNHNEMNGFDVNKKTKDLSKGFKFIFLQDSSDHPRVIKRFLVLEQQYKSRRFIVKTIETKGKSEMERVFSSLLLADWFAFYTAKNYGLEAEQVPMVEEFKKMIG